MGDDNVDPAKLTVIQLKSALTEHGFENSIPRGAVKKARACSGPREPLLLYPSLLQRVFFGNGRALLTLLRKPPCW